VGPAWGQGARTQRGAALAATVYHEVSVPLAPPGAEGDVVELREPPTRITATGRIVASELCAWKEEGGRRMGNWCCSLAALPMAAGSMKHACPCATDKLTPTPTLNAVGDLHGDMDKTIASLSLAKVITLDEEDRPRWTGGDTVVVQLGDVLDRGNVEIGGWRRGGVGCVSVLLEWVQQSSAAAKEHLGSRAPTSAHTQRCPHLLLPPKTRRHHQAADGAGQPGAEGGRRRVHAQREPRCGSVPNSVLCSHSCPRAHPTAVVGLAPHPPLTRPSTPPQSPHPAPTESLNVCGDFRYVTPGAFIESAVEFGIPRETALRSWDGCIQARAALYLPGGRVAKMLSRNPTVLIVNDTAFAHGGLLPTHGEGGSGSGWGRWQRIAGQRASRF
jgi:hypothetical protein